MCWCLLMPSTLAVALSGCGVQDATPGPTGAGSPIGGQPTASAATATPTTDGFPSPTDRSSLPTDGSPWPSIDPQAGLRWQLVDTPVFVAADVVADAALLGSLVIAVGSSEDEMGNGTAAAWYSADGFTWQPADSLPGAENASIDALAAGAGGIVGVGFDYSDDDVPAVWHSVDGRSWTRVSDDDLTGGQMSAVVATADGYLALGANYDDGTALAWTSADGGDWTAASSIGGLGVGAAVKGVVASGSGLVAYGTSAEGAALAWYSADGLDWQLAGGFAGELEGSVNDVAVAGDRLIAVGVEYLDDGARTLAWMSTDGVTWQRQPVDLDGEMIGVEPLGDGFLAVGTMPQPNELDCGAAAWAFGDGAGWEALPHDAVFEQARMYEPVTAPAGVVVIGDRALDAACEEVAPAVWIGVSREQARR